MYVSILTFCSIFGEKKQTKNTMYLAEKNHLVTKGTELSPSSNWSASRISSFSQTTQVNELTHFAVKMASYLRVNSEEHHNGKEGGVGGGTAFNCRHLALQFVMRFGQRETVRISRHG